MASSKIKLSAIRQKSNDVREINAGGFWTDIFLHKEL